MRRFALLGLAAAAITSEPVSAGPGAWNGNEKTATWRVFVQVESQSDCGARFASSAQRGTSPSGKATSDLTARPCHALSVER